MKKSLFLFVLALLPLVARAVDFTDANGIIYELVSKGSMKVAKVKGATAALKATKVLNIPSTVSDGTDTYTVTTICGSSFVGDAGNLLPLDQVTIPATITAIEDNAFMMSDIKILNVEDLEAWCKITITSSNEWNSYNTYIYPEQFCVKGTIVKDLVIPSSITSICNGFFRGFKCFDSVTIPGNVETIGDYAFTGCSMSSLSLGEGINYIGMEAFSNCGNISSVIIPKSCGNYGAGNVGIFSNCEKLTSVEIKGNVGEGMFKDCANLTNLAFSTNTSQISSNAFSGTGLVSVIIPYTVYNISDNAFANCSKLKTVTIKYDSDDSGSYLGMSLAWNSFGNCPLLEDFYCEVPFNSMYANMNPFEDSYVNEGATLHVPSADVTSYQTTDPWSQFSNVVALPSTTPPGPSTKCDKPTISYNSATGTIDFTCTTDGVDFVSSVTSADVNSYTGSTINLTLKFTVSVYATKAGLDNSDVATKDIEIVIGDMDGDGNVNAADVVKLVNKIMNP